MVGGVIPNLAYPLAMSYIAIENGLLTIDLPIPDMSKW